MITDFHLLRPYWLFALIPFIILAWWLLTRSSALRAWQDVCDAHLLKHLIHTKQQSMRAASLGILLVSALLMIIAMAGPSWSRYPVPTFKQILPRIIVLDMSDHMLLNDLQPSRLKRAKFKLHDLLQFKDVGQFGMIAYTSEPFIVFPLTDDAKTIDALLSALTPDIMPVKGQRLDNALNEAAKLINQSGYQRGDVLVLTGSAPTPADINTAKLLAKEGIHTSVMPVVKENPSISEFNQLSTAGHGELIPFLDTSTDLSQWLNATNDRQRYTASLKNDIPVWKDQGRWFLIPALILLLPVFRRGWLQRLTT